MLILEGNPRQMGWKFGKAFPDKIRENLKILVWREGYEPLPKADADFVKWRKRQETLLRRNWPWLLEEMSSVAEAIEADFEDILLLNLRAWQYEYYGAPAGTCSSLAITLNDGTVAGAGALDESDVYLCGVVVYRPESGYSFVTTPFSGTSWALRGMNEMGLSTGVSSQILPGLQKSENTINGDLAIRIILQTCGTVEEVRSFCRDHPFTMNLVCVDAQGQVFCGHQTSVGLFEIPVHNCAAMTNHIIGPEIKKRLVALGTNGFPTETADPTTFDRRDNLVDFARRYKGKCTAQEVREFLSVCDENHPGSINRKNKGTAYLTYANPQNDTNGFWIMAPHDPTYNNQFQRIEIVECEDKGKS